MQAAIPHVEFGGSSQRKRPAARHCSCPPLTTINSRLSLSARTAAPRGVVRCASHQLPFPVQLHELRKYYVQHQCPNLYTDLHSIPSQLVFHLLLWCPFSMLVIRFVPFLSLVYAVLTGTGKIWAVIITWTEDVCPAYDPLKHLFQPVLIQKRATV